MGEILGIPSDSPVGKFIAATEGRGPDEVGAALADAREMHMASEASAQAGQTAAPDTEMQTDHHLISFVEKDGCVYELDGAKLAPINHGPSNGNLLLKTTQVIKKEFMDIDP